MDEALILIVDDQSDNLDTIMGYLSESDFNYKFSQAMNGEVACKVAAKRLPDLIIMDWEMPVMNGYDALIGIKGNELTADIPIIMATGRSSSEDLDRALNAGAADYIRKPIEKQELLARVRSCLSISKFIKEIKLKNEKLSDLNRERDGMIDVLAHDLKSPLNGIQGCAQMIVSYGDLNERQQKYIDRINGLIQAGVYLITDLLDIHEYEHQDSKLDKSKINLDIFIEDWQRTFDRELKQKDQQMHVEINQDDIEIKADKVALTRILDNLVSNAIKFSSKGKNIYMRITKESETLDFSIRDEGPGISEKEQKSMFKLFQKLSPRPTDGESSNGLGLSIIKTLVEKLDGEIIVNSELGKGSEFVIKLPLN